MAKSMSDPDQLSLSKLKTIVRIAVIGQVLMLIGLTADMTTIVTSAWFVRLRSFGLFRLSSYALNLALTGVVIYIFKTASAHESALQTMIRNEEAKLSNLIVHDMSLWKRFIRTWRSLALEELPNPSKRDALEPLLDELTKRLPDNGADYKLAIAKPEANGTFKILADRGMDPSTVFTIQQKANWKEKRSLFSNVLESGDAKYATFPSGSTNYLDIQDKVGVGQRPTSSASHFIVPIRHDIYYHKLPKQTLALVSIGIPKGREIQGDQEQALFQAIYPIIKGIEGVLLGCALVERAQPTNIVIGAQPESKLE
jgi:hypothetical protein